MIECTLFVVQVTKSLVSCGLGFKVLKKMIGNKRALFFIILSSGKKKGLTFLGFTYASFDHFEVCIFFFKK